MSSGRGVDWAQAVNSLTSSPYSHKAQFSPAARHSPKISSSSLNSPSKRDDLSLSSAEARELMQDISGPVSIDSDGHFISSPSRSSSATTSPLSGKASPNHNSAPHTPTAHHSSRPSRLNILNQPLDDDIPRSPMVVVTDQGFMDAN
ncbi:hypothetical protein J8273_7097 [Carpediemonas membranifera]|uniref:Uncharacterized protein n=1 Tax=Carpediemonas membranifera TaxID=201153 RepID=A0A8J6AQC0_9EUKA|nr:hypothetical protein J8273_7097 [Carpediemonas membranifera]|eukprot:KAG9390838.1 hypothetical protein J8273_7097 [Carpediemonas membranifera]